MSDDVKNKDELKKLLIDQVENRVRWRESVLNMIDKGVNHFIEIGPGKVLSGLIKRINKDVKINTINNAGVNQDNLSIRMNDDEWKKVIDINLSATFLTCKYAIKKMLKKKYGRIINITSIVGHTGNLGQANYAASKAGMIAFSKRLTIE